MTGAEALCRTLRDLGVRHVFGLPGTQNAELYSLFPEHSIRPILASQETSAAFMANGYARASGGVGVLATIPGPGFTYAIPGLAEARLDSAALLHIVGTPASGPGARFQHQRIDQRGIAGPLVKEVVEVREPAAMTDAVRRAHRRALAGEPGPVLLHVDPPAMRGRVSEGSSVPAGAEGAGPAAPDGAAADAPWRGPLVTRLTSSARPVVFAGAGAAAAAASVVELAERLKAPAFTTVSGRGVVPEDHPNALGFDPDRGRVSDLNELLDRSDLILALGCKLSHIGSAGFRLRLEAEKLVHVNTDREALGPNYAPDLAIEASVERVLSAVLEGPEIGASSEWTDAEVAEWKATISAPEASDTEPRFPGVEGGGPPAFFRALRSALPREGTLVTDAGLHQVLARRYFPVWAAGGLLTPTDFQSMGFGLPAAIGAKLADPDRPVVAVIGDGGLLISATDLLCAVRERVPVVVVVFNDGFLNLIRLQQLRDHGRPSATELRNPDLGVLAEALEASYHRLSEDEDPEDTFRAALAEEGPSLIDVPLRDSSGIRRAERRGKARHLVRRTLGRRTIERIRRWLGR